MRAYSYVIEFLYIVEPQTYTEVMKLDEMLKKYHNRIPAHLQPGNLYQIAYKTPATMMESCSSKSFTIKPPFFFIANIGTPHCPETQMHLVYFQDECVYYLSSMALLKIQVSMYEASQQGGILQDLMVAFP